MFKNLLVISLFISTIALSQTGTTRSFTQGYVVLTGDDTLKGNLAMLSDEESCEHVYFKKATADTATTFTAADLKGYKRESAVYSGRMIADKKWGFVKVIEKGRVNVYQYAYV